MPPAEQGGTEIPSQAGRVAVVTGGNSGIGFETARALAAAGATVVIAARDAGRAADAVAEILTRHPGAAVETVPLDLARLRAVAEAAAAVRARHPRLDLLVNNAGVMTPPVRQATEDGFELQLGSNHLGHFALTLRLLPALLAAPAPRVVNVSSLAHRHGRIDFEDLQAERRYRPWRAYGQSKLANLLFTFELERRARAAGWPLAATAAHPGWAITRLQSTGPRLGGDGSPPLQERLMRAFEGWFAQSAADGALPTLRAATDPALHGGAYVGPGGAGEVRGRPAPARVSARARDEAAARRLWEVSEALTGVRLDDVLAAAA